LILGVGSGHLKPEFKTLGADFERRGRVSDEYLRAIAAAWEQDVARFEGDTVSFHDVMVSPRVAQRPRPPFWVGGNSPAALRRAARLGEGWVPWQLGPEEFAGLAERARRLREESGRSGPFELVAPLGAPPPPPPRRRRRPTRSSPTRPAGGRRAPRRSTSVSERRPSRPTSAAWNGSAPRSRRESSDGRPRRHGGSLAATRSARHRVGRRAG